MTAQYSPNNLTYINKLHETFYHLDTFLSLTNFLFLDQNTLPSKVPSVLCFPFKKKKKTSQLSIVSLFHGLSTPWGKDRHPYFSIFTVVSWVFFRKKLFKKTSFEYICEGVCAGTFHNSSFHMFSSMNRMIKGFLSLMWHTHLKYFWSSPDRNNVVGFSSLIPQCIVPVTVIGILSNSNAQACVPSKLRILKNWGHKLVLFVSSAHVMMLGIQLILQSSPLLNGHQISCIIEGVQRHCLAYSSF